MRKIVHFKRKILQFSVARAPPSQPLIPAAFRQLHLTLQRRRPPWQIRDLTEYLKNWKETFNFADKGVNESDNLLRFFVTSLVFDFIKKHNKWNEYQRKTFK